MAMRSARAGVVRDRAVATARRLGGPLRLVASRVGVGGVRQPHRGRGARRVCRRGVRAAAGRCREPGVEHQGWDEFVTAVRQVLEDQPVATWCWHRITRTGSCLRNELGPHGLAGVPLVPTPAQRHRIDQSQPAPRPSLRRRRPLGRAPAGSSSTATYSRRSSSSTSTQNPLRARRTTWSSRSATTITTSSMTSPRTRHRTSTRGRSRRTRPTATATGGPTNRMRRGRPTTTSGMTIPVPGPRGGIRSPVVPTSRARNQLITHRPLGGR